MSVAVPASCATALKEWATVLEAMSRGEQLILIRKGGLIEPGSGFELMANAFVFYPTFEHQAVNYVRPDYRGYFDDAVRRRAPDGAVRIDLAGIAVCSVQSQDAGIIDRLCQCHIYNEAFVSQRLKWQPSLPLTLVVVRAFRLAAPHVLPVTPRYAGCKSWVELDSAVPLDGARPVVDDAAFERQLAHVKGVLQGSAE